MWDAAHVAFEMYGQFLFKCSNVLNPASDCVTWMQENVIKYALQDKYPLMYDYIVTGESVIAQFAQKIAD